ncbi:uncharacterized protein LOC116935165 isoform X2 [Daphnia magna]|uniref:uncharacterized protein LOC116935165 isoform X2 n=1 Tax=Daphnia magna TaxID=35525 RepID=UPI001E1BC85C|nr:uncharacterized protein LOC116935165 isoform X2 [Daphnia magna]
MHSERKPAIVREVEVNYLNGPSQVKPLRKLTLRMSKILSGQIVSQNHMAEARKLAIVRQTLSEVGLSCKETTNTIINDIKQLVIQQNGIIGQNDRSRLDLELFGIAIPWTTFYGCVFYVPDCDCPNSSSELYLCKLDIRLYGGKVVEQLSESVSHVLVCGSCDNRHLSSSNETKQKFVTKQ